MGSNASGEPLAHQVESAVGTGPLARGGGTPPTRNVASDGDESDGIGARIKQLRQAKKKRQSDVERDLDLSPTTVSRWERAEHGLSAEALTALAKYFEVSVEYLTSGEQPPGARSVIEVEIAPDVLAKINSMFPPGREPTRSELQWVAAHENFSHVDPLAIAQAINSMRHGMTPAQAKASARATGRFRDPSVPPRRK